VSVEIDQVWHQDNARPVHCLYTFPLPAGAAVYRCELHVNDRLLVAKVEELEEARRIAREKKAAGHRTALVEQVRDNVFELALGNLAPGDVAVIRLAYVQALERDGRDASFRLPMCPGVRYIAGNPLLRDNQGRGTGDDTDQVPDASRITPPRIDALHPDAAYVSVGNHRRSARVMANLASPTHALLTRDEVDCKRGVARPARCRAGPRFRRALDGSRRRSSAWTDRSAVLSASWRRRPGADRPVQDVYFLLDRSGSMGGVTWGKPAQRCGVFRPT
jgi:Ca-activated chloride channel family protein